VLGSVYLLSRRNPWTAILAHGFIYTIAVAYTYLGLNN
jgi:membrane protease YdiL (CAAX protease family)